MGQRRAARLRHRGGTRIQRHRHRPGPAGRLSRGALSPRGPQGPDDPAQLSLPRVQRQRCGAESGGGRLRALDPVGIRRGGRDRRSRAHRLHALPDAGHRRLRGPPAPGHLPSRPEPQLRVPAHGHELPREHRDGGVADLCSAGRRDGRRPLRRGWRRRLRGRRQCRGQRGRGHGAHAPLLHPVARAGRVHAARARLAVRLRRHVLPGLFRRAGRANDPALHPTASSGEAGSERGHERARRAPRLLPRSRDAGAGTFCAPGRGQMVEPGVRGSRLHRRLPGRDPARGREQPRRALQRHQLGAPLDAGLEHGRLGHRSAHRRDPQGQRDAGVAAGAPGLHDRRGAAGALRERRRGGERHLGVGAGAHPSALGARGGAHAGSGAQLLRQRRRTHLGDGLSPPADYLGRQRVRLLRGVRRRHRRVGQGHDPVRVLRLPAGSRRGGGAGPDSGRGVGGGHPLLHQPGRLGARARRPVVERDGRRGRA